MADETEDIEKAEGEVEAAIESVEEAAADAPSQEDEVALEEISKVLGEAKELLAQINTRTEESAAEPEAETQAAETSAAEPAVEVGEPAKEYRHVRRFGRKVRREK